ncbi:MAG: hypothetical protein LBT46_06340 [Planctomycetaceae bacterium]|nr:hypothetical protein [Planctomycetaceae bacterium]
MMLLFLERMDWQVSAAASGNWFKTVQGFPFNDSDWDWQDATVDFFYDYDKTKKQYVLCDHRIKIARDSDDYRWQCALNGDIGLNFSGKVTEIAGDFWTFVYYDTGSLAEFYFCNKDIFPDVTAPCQIEWDEKGKKILDPYAEKNTIIGTTSILTKNT